MTNFEKCTNWIKENYSEEKILSAIDNQILEYVDAYWESEGYDSEYDWYRDHCTNEAETDVLYDIARIANDVNKTRCLPSDIAKFISEQYDISI